MDNETIAWFLIFLIPIVLIFKFLRRSKMWHADGLVMRGKTVIITGANTGIGFETASELARYGAKVILACRDSAKAEVARGEIINRLRNKDGQENIEQRVLVEQLDLTSFDSIRAFSERMLKQLNRLDVLINNAGVAFLREKRLTKDGLEMTMGTNHFGHFLLTNLLLPLLKKSAPSRIVVVSSRAYKFGKLEFDNLNSERSYRSLRVYADSKLANVLFTRELARRLEGTGVVVNALHPGDVLTEVNRYMFKPVYLFIVYVLKIYLKSALQGAQTSIYLAASQSPEVLESGHYYSDCSVESLKAHAMDDATAKKLWEVSERISKLT